MDGFLLNLPVYRVLYSYIKQCPPAFSLYFVTTKRVWPCFLRLFARLKFRLQSKGFWSLLRSYWAKTTISSSETPLDLIVTSQVIIRDDNGHWRQPYNFVQVFFLFRINMFDICNGMFNSMIYNYSFVLFSWFTLTSDEKAFVWILFWYFKVQ